MEMLEREIFKTGWKALGFKSYNDYLLSDVWRERAKIKLEQHPYCQVCDAPKKYRAVVDYKRITLKNGETKLIEVWGYIGKDLQVHHKTYRTVGNEDQDDLIVLCKDCHIKEHNNNDYYKR